MAAVACLVGFAIAPLILLLAAVVLLVTAAILHERLGSWRVPVIVTAVLAILLSGGMLLVSHDFGADECAGGRCDEEMPFTMVPMPG